MAKLPDLTLDVLQGAVKGDAAAIRSITRLQPAGGKGDKVFPPTYATDRGATTKYAFELRRVDGQDVPTVLLDSVASQANRMEEALLAAWEARRIDVPVIAVDFSGEEGISDLDRITTLQAPHRIADALLRDSLDGDGTRFRDTAIGQAFTNASAKNATAIYRYCPTALVFGVWDSTGPRGGLGHKIQRALVSEVVGVGAVAGVKTASRLDPAGIQKNTHVFHHRDNPEEWTTDEEEALLEKGKPVLFSRGNKGEKGWPAAINHGNFPPLIDAIAGGVTLDYALQTTVLSLPALRRLRFQEDAQGARLEGDRRVDAERAARCVLAALALVAITELREQGYDLRSRSFLVPEEGGPLTLELVPSDGGEPKRYSLTAHDAAALLASALAEATRLGLPWDREPVTLKPAPKLSGLIRESRRRASTGEGEEAEAAS